MATRSCTVCNNSSNNRFISVREMMFGLRESFEYMECHQCGCVQLCTVPADQGRYYPSSYYPDTTGQSSTPRLKRWLQHQRASYCLHGTGLIGRAMTIAYGRPTCGIFGRPDYYTWLRKCGVGFSSRIADVGCGSALLLERMAADGFEHLVGIDPFVEPRTSADGRLQILKSDIHSVTERFDLVMLHHTFEHLPEPLRVMRKIHALLNPGSYLLIRIPVASCFAYRHYGVNWAQLDAPRHLYLHTLKSMQILAEQSGLVLADTVFDSTDFQFWASEQYTKDIPLRDERSYSSNAAASIFTPDDIARFKEKAHELNRNRDGDSACFYLQKPPA
jgi:SAM-dependent methyltransferase